MGGVAHSPSEAPYFEFFKKSKNKNRNKNKNENKNKNKNKKKNENKTKQEFFNAGGEGYFTRYLQGTLAGATLQGTLKPKVP